eukprot:13432090-Heterocapsa_arctica.AAC.1
MPAAALAASIADAPAFVPRDPAHFRDAFAAEWTAGLDLSFYRLLGPGGVEVDPEAARRALEAGRAAGLPPSFFFESLDAGGGRAAGDGRAAGGSGAGSSAAASRAASEAPAVAPQHP